MRAPVVESWGRLRTCAQSISRPWFGDQIGACLISDGTSCLARGLGRSYGDVGSISGGRVIDATRLDRFISADWRNGVIRAESGLSIAELLRVCAPKGWFLPVAPGTKHVTLGGAVANDVHGKNHETAGTIGRHVRRIRLARSDGARLDLSAEQNPELFAATIGGLGLTGFICWIELSLIPIRSCFFETEALPFETLDGFFDLMREAADWPYSAAWVDAAATGRSLGRGILFRGRHAAGGGLEAHKEPRWRAPSAPLLNAVALRALSAAYRARPRAPGVKPAHYEQFLFPLDGVENWNRLYGARGFYQHQSVAPATDAREVIRALLRVTAASGETPGLAVLKLFGDVPSPGLLSFPMPGATLAIDFPNRGKRTLQLLKDLAAIARSAGGRLYPAKDATMSVSDFHACFPRWRELEALRDPGFGSDFWRRVTA